jgi:hypothetical protein
LDGQNELVISLGFTSPLPLVCEIRKANCQELADLLFAISVWVQCHSQVFSFSSNCYLRNALMEGRVGQDNHDLEGQPSIDDIHLYNDTVNTISWCSIHVHLPDKATQTQKDLLKDLSGNVKAGSDFP